MRSFRIQPRELSNGTLPYPYFVDESGMVGRQDFWKGKPFKLIGFSPTNIAGDFGLGIKPFADEPQKAVGMYPVFSDKDDNWYTLNNVIDSVSEVEKQ